MIPLYTRPNLQGDADFKLASSFAPAGDQPQAIDSLVQGLKEHQHKLHMENMLMLFQCLVGILNEYYSFDEKNQKDL